MRSNIRGGSNPGFFMNRVIFVSNYGEYELSNIACAAIASAPKRKNGRLDRRYAAFENAVRLMRRCLPKKVKPEVGRSL